MKQLNNLFLLVAVVLSMFGCSEITKTDTEPVNVQFGFINKSPLSDTRSVDKVPVAIIISIEQGSTLIHTSLELPVHDFDGVILTEPLPLLTGTYEITEFKVINAADVVIYATPMDGSTAAKLVDDGLPISFVVSEDNTTAVTPQVLDTEEFTAADFGYPPLGFEIIPIFHFLISAKYYDTVSSAYVMTEANVQVTSDGHIDFDEGIDDSTRAVLVRDIDTATYIITVSKPGFDNWVDTFTNTELKTHDCVEVGEIPVNVILSGGSLAVHVVKVSAGDHHTLILKSDNTLWTTGYNHHGELGDGTNSNRNISMQIMSGVIDICAGRNHSLILKSDNTLWATGNNSSGQLGDGTNSNRNSPVMIMSGVVDFSAGYKHSLILKSDNTLWATGWNINGQLGDGMNSDRNSPVLIMSEVIDMSAGTAHSLILKSDNTLWTTGLNNSGQLGDGTNSNRNSPVMIMSGVIDISAGDYHSLILKSDNTLWSTGRNEYGQLGDGTNSDRNSPVQIMSGVIAVSAGNSLHSLILKSDNTLWATGFNEYGQLGDGTNSDRNSFVHIMSEVIDVFAGTLHSLILKSDHTLWATGENAYGQLGDGTNINTSTFKQIIP